MGCAELPKLLDNGTNNNYGSWKNQAYYKLQEWGLWKYIEGPRSQPPTIPTLHLIAAYHGLDNGGHITTNKEEYEVAVVAAKPWYAENELALDCVYNALLDQSLHLLLDNTYAKDAWECLCSNYQSQNSVRVVVIKGQIMTYHCMPDMNVAKWLTDMQHLYTTLCGIEIECMMDHKFALAILDLMPQDTAWMSFVSGLQDKLHDADSQKTMFHLVTLISCIWDKYWCWHKDNNKT